MTAARSKSTIRKYLKAFQTAWQDAQLNGSTSVEMATRPEAHGLIRAIVELSGAQSVRIYHDSAVKGTKNKPDWRLEDKATFGTYFYGDQKNLNTKSIFVLSQDESAQVERYLQMGRPLFIFDGIEFLFYEPATFPAVERMSIVPKPLAAGVDWSSLPIDGGVVDKFQQLFGNPGYRRWTETQLIEQLAIRARYIADEIVHNLSARSAETERGEHLVRVLLETKRTLAKHHDPTLRDDRACAEFVSQVLVFGLFYAHTQAVNLFDTPSERLGFISSFWSGHVGIVGVEELRPFRVILDLLENELDSDLPLANAYRDVISLLAFAEYMGTTSSGRDFHVLFEEFFTGFNPIQRYERGAFYTPTALTGWLVELTDSLLTRGLGLKLAEVDKIVDPCCGTGGFLEAIIERFSQDSPSHPEVVGFEILPAPYALANYRLHSNLIEESEISVDVILTDTLSDLLFDAGTLQLDLGSENARAVSAAKAPVRLVIGNPPSSILRSSNAPRQRISGLMEDFRPPEMLRTGRSNIQQALNNEAYRFLRWSADRILETGRGMVSLILPEGFATNPTLKFARQWLCEKFNSIWVIHLDEEVRTGVRTQSLFAVRQGRIAVVLTLSGEAGVSAPAATASAEVMFLTIATMKFDEKIQFLQSDIDLSLFRPIDCLDENGFQFYPSVIDAENIDLWTGSWPLKGSLNHKGVFESKCSAVKLAPTALLFHTDENRLLARSRSLADRNFAGELASPESIIENWFKGQQKPPNARKLSAGVRNAVVDAAQDPERTVIDYSFRPFVSGSVLIDDGIFAALKSVPGDGPRARPEVRAAFANGALGLAVAPAPRDIGSEMARFVSFAWSLPDNDLASRGNAMIYCDRTAGGEFAGGSGAVKSNVEDSIKRLFSFATDPARGVLYYSYAIFSSSAYLERFGNFLFVSSDDSTVPRLPIFSDHETRKSIMELGMQIAQCEDPNHVFEFDVSGSAWPDSLNEFRLKSYIIDGDSESILLAGENGEKVLATDIPAAVSSLKIGGHDVVSKWLRERKYPYLRRTFRKKDLTELYDLCGRVSFQQNLIREVDLVLIQALSRAQNDPGVLVPPVPK